MSFEQGGTCSSTHRLARPFLFVHREGEGGGSVVSNVIMMTPAGQVVLVLLSFSDYKDEHWMRWLTHSLTIINGPCCKTQCHENDSLLKYFNGSCTFFKISNLFFAVSEGVLVSVNV